MAGKRVQQGRVTPDEVGNFGFVCDEHAPKAGRFKDEKPEQFVGRFVKLGFTVKDGPTKVEHMWVNVSVYNEEKKEFEGTLDNDPIYADIEYGDGVAFTIDEIEDVMPALRE